MIYTSEKEIAKHLKNKIKIDNNSLVFLHLNISGLGILKNGMTSIINAFSKVLKKGVLVIPTFTYSWSNKKKFSTKTLCDPKNVGLFSNFVLKSKKFKRTHNPNFSVAVMDNTKGKSIEKRLINKKTVLTCFGKNSVFDIMYNYSKKKKSFIILLGGAHDDVQFRTTFLHYIEEELLVPYRYKKKIYNPKNKRKYIIQFSRYLTKKEYIENSNTRKEEFKFPINPSYKKLGIDLLKKKY